MDVNLSNDALVNLISFIFALHGNVEGRSNLMRRGSLLSVVVGPWLVMDAEGVNAEVVHHSLKYLASEQLFEASYFTSLEIKTLDK